MDSGSRGGKGTPPFKRKSVILPAKEREALIAGVTHADQTPVEPSSPTKTLHDLVSTKAAAQNSSAALSVLMVNGSTAMAEEMTRQLALRIPDCAITYAPTVELARWMLLRRKVDLVVSDAMLPDGSVDKLKEVLERLPTPPDVVVVGSLSAKTAGLLSNSSYEFAALRHLGQEEHTEIYEVDEAPPRSEPVVTEKIRTLGADLRNDLNNPLQEIVAMVFVARAGETATPATSQALEAIDKAAKNMASVVYDLEDRIRSAVVEK